MKKYTVLVVGLALILPIAAGAAEFSKGDVVNLGVHPGEMVRENVYAAGGTVNVVGTVDGDLYVAGGTVNLMGTVTKDVTVVGGTLIVTGKIGDDLRVVGGNVTVGGSIGGELVAIGGNVNVLPSTTVGAEAYIVGGVINLSGSFPADLVMAGGQIYLAEGLMARNNFDYYSQKEAKISDGAIILGTTTFHQQAVKKNTQSSKSPFFGLFAFMTIWVLLGLAGAIILACLLFYLWKQESKEMIEAAFASPGRELIRGFVVLIVLPIAAIICLITLVGLPLGFLAGVFYVALIILGAATTGLLWAGLLAKFVFKRKETDINWWLIILAALVLALVKLIPFVGWLIGFLVFLVGFGVLSNKIYSKLMPKK